MASCEDSNSREGDAVELTKSCEPDPCSKDLANLIDDYYHNFSIKENNLILKYLQYSERNNEMVAKMEGCLQLIEKFETKLEKIRCGMEKMGIEFDTIRQNSVEINHCISNRTVVLSSVSTFMDDVSVTKEMINVLVNDPVTSPSFKVKLEELIMRENLCREYDSINAKSILLLKKTLSKLGVKVVNKLKEFIIGRINFCKIPSTNYAIIQNSLLSSKFLLDYIQLRGSDTYKEIQDHYIDTMRSLYFNGIRNCYQNLQKKFDSSLSQNSRYLLASQKRITDFGNLASFALSADRVRSDELFLLGHTKEVLNEEFLLQPYIVQLMKSDAKLSAEKIFRSLLYSLICNCQAELEFITNFFCTDESRSNRIFEEIFGRCFQSLLLYMDKFLSNSPDLIVIVVCICVVNRYIVVLASKSLHVAIKYLSSMLEMLWFRFNELFNKNLTSFYELEAPSPSELSLAPHFVTQRSSNLLSSLISLRGETKFPRLEKIINILIKELAAFVYKCSDNYANELDKLTFIGNNLYLIRKTVSSTTSIPLPSGFSFDKANQKFTFTEFREEVINDIVVECGQILDKILQLNDDNVFTRCGNIIEGLQAVEDEEKRNTHLIDLEELTTTFVTYYMEGIRININRFKSLFVFQSFSHELVQRYLNQYLRNYNHMLNSMNDPKLGLHKLTSRMPDIQALTIEIQSVDSAMSK